MEGFCDECVEQQIIRPSVINRLSLVRDGDVTCHVAYLVTKSMDESWHNSINT
jgi:hypothetical protein